VHQIKTVFEDGKTFSSSVISHFVPQLVTCEAWLLDSQSWRGIFQSNFICDTNYICHGKHVIHTETLNFLGVSVLFLGYKLVRYKLTDIWTDRQKISQQSPY